MNIPTIIQKQKQKYLTIRSLVAFRKYRFVIIWFTVFCIAHMLSSLSDESSVLFRPRSGGELLIFRMAFCVHYLQNRISKVVMIRGSGVEI